MNKNRIDSILWDFDGVLMNSNTVRDKGFTTVLENYPAHQVKALLDFHKANGGLSRYIKFKYFFEDIRKEELSDDRLEKLCGHFSKIMKTLLVDESLLIPETLDFVAKHHQTYKMHIVSGSDQLELRYLCKELGISKYFLSIHGSPTPKNQLVEMVIKEYNYKPENTVLIGDSINDFEAAKVNGIEFIGYNNPSLYIHTTIPKNDVTAKLATLIHG